MPASGRAPEPWGWRTISRSATRSGTKFVQNSVLDAEYRRRGISVSEDESGAGHPDISACPSFKRSPNSRPIASSIWPSTSAGSRPVSRQQYLPSLEAQYRDELQRAKLLRLVTSDIYLSDAALWERYRDEHEKVKIGLTAIIARNAVPDSSVQVSDAEMAAYYKAHRDEFQRPRRHT